MAGISLELQKLMRRDGVLNGLAAHGHAAVIIAGPWIFTILAIAMITLLTEQFLGLDALANFRIVLIYSFALSQLATAPVVILATRMMSDMIHGGIFNYTSRLLLSSLCVGAALAVLLAGGVLYVGFDLSGPVLFAAIFANCLIGLIWVALIFCGAIRDYGAISFAFIAGLSAALVLSIVFIQLGYSTLGLIWAFSIGLCLTLFWLLARILINFPHRMENAGVTFAMMRAAARRHGALIAGAVLSVLGIWIDKLVMWFSAAGQTLMGGLLHAPLYDSAMFIAYLTIIPALAAFILHLETSFFTQIRTLNSNIKNHATLVQIENETRTLTEETRQGLWKILALQFVISMIAIALSPLIIDMFNMQYRQIGILRVGMLGAVFQFVFLASTALLLFLNQSAMFLRLQALFFVLNGGLTWLALQAGQQYWGYGYLAASMIAGMWSMLQLERKLERLPFIIFTFASTRSGDNDWLDAAQEESPRHGRA